MRQAAVVLFVVALAACGRSGGEEVGEFSNDWLGNEVKVVALKDPKVDGVTCHLAHFDRGFWDRVGNGEWFTNPSNSSIACRQTGPIAMRDVAQGEAGEAVFNQRQSLVFRNMTVRRIYDAANESLLYVAYTRRPARGSAEISISTISLYGQTAGGAQTAAETAAP
jgi:CreA protein